MKKILYLLSLLTIILCVSCKDNSKYEFDKEMYTPTDNIDTTNKQLGYIYPKGQVYDRSSFSQMFLENGLTYTYEYFMSIDGKRNDSEIYAGANRYSFSIKIYPSDNLSIKPVGKEDSSHINLDKSGSINLYNNNNLIGNIEYYTDYDETLSYKHLETFIKDNFYVYEISNELSFLTNYNVADIDGYKKLNVKNSDYKGDALDGYLLEYTFKNDDNDKFFNNLYLSESKYYYLQTLGYSDGTNYSFSVFLDLYDNSNIDLTKISYEEIEPISPLYKYEFNIILDGNVVGNIKFHTTLDMKETCLDYLNLIRR